MASDSKHRAFFEATRGPQRSYFGEQKALESVLRMIRFNHGLMGDFMAVPSCTSQTNVLQGPPGLSGG